MKTSTLTLAAALPLLCAALASAQIAPVRLSAPVNPVAGLPKLLPSPMTGPLAGMGISLPTVVPSLAPAPALLAAAAPAPAPLPAALPSRRVPVLPVAPSRDTVINPLRRIMPGVTVRFGEQKPAEKTAPDAGKDRLDELFDGDGEIPGLNRGPVGHERRISLPEDDLMRELGF